MITEMTLLDELVAAEIEPLDEINEVCAAMMAERTGVTNGTFVRRLRKMEAEGKLTSRAAIWRGRQVIAFRKVKEE